MPASCSVAGRADEAAEQRSSAPGRTEHPRGRSGCCADVGPKPPRPWRCISWFMSRHAGRWERGTRARSAPAPCAPTRPKACAIARRSRSSASISRPTRRRDVLVPGPRSRRAPCGSGSAGRWPRWFCGLRLLSAIASSPSRFTKRSPNSVGAERETRRRWRSSGTVARSISLAHGRDVDRRCRLSLASGRQRRAPGDDRRANAARREQPGQVERAERQVRADDDRLPLAQMRRRRRRAPSLWP